MCIAIVLVSSSDLYLEDAFPWNHPQPLTHTIFLSSLLLTTSLIFSLLLIDVIIFWNRYGSYLYHIYSILDIHAIHWHIYTAIYRILSSLFMLFSVY